MMITVLRKEINRGMKGQLSRMVKDVPGEVDGKGRRTCISRLTAIQLLHVAVSVVGSDE